MSAFLPSFLPFTHSLTQSISRLSCRSRSRFLFFFGSGSFSAAFVQLEITFIRCLNCSYCSPKRNNIKKREEKKQLNEGKKKESTLKCKLSFRQKTKLYLPRIYVHALMCWLVGRLQTRLHIMENYFTFNRNNRPKQNGYIIKLHDEYTVADFACVYMVVTYISAVVTF